MNLNLFAFPIQLSSYVAKRFTLRLGICNCNLKLLIAVSNFVIAIDYY